MVASAWWVAGNEILPWLPSYELGMHVGQPPAESNQNQRRKSDSQIQFNIMATTYDFV